MSFWLMIKDYFKRVRQFYGLQRQDSQSLEERREAYTIFPRTTDYNKQLPESSNDNIKTINASYKSIERK